VSSFCEQCGTALGENAKFCAACGAQATANTTTPDAPATVQPSASWWSRQSKINKTGLMVGAVFVLLVIIAAVTGNSNKTNAADSNPTTSAATATPAARTTVSTPPTALTPRQRVRQSVGESVEAGGYAGTLKIKQLSFYRTTVDIVTETPQGGFNGPSCGDLDAGAGAIFQKIFDGTGWKGAAWIDYRGGLVSKATGKPVNAVTGSFGINPAQAKHIDWSNSDELSNVDWSIYRHFCHPALR
jgi:zinc ribbon protein